MKSKTSSVRTQRQLSNLEVSARERFIHVLMVTYVEVFLSMCVHVTEQLICMCARHKRACVCVCVFVWTRVWGHMCVLHLKALSVYTHECVRMCGSATMVVVVCECVGSVCGSM